MAIYGAFDISGSGLQAQRVRMDAISANLANRNTPGFQVKTVEFAPGDPATGNPLGVHVAAIEAELRTLADSDPQSSAFTGLFSPPETVGRP